MCRQSPCSERHRYATVGSDKLGTDPMAYDALNTYMDVTMEIERNPVSKHQIKSECGK